VVGYDGGRNLKDEEHPVGQKKLIRKAEPPSKRGIAWPRWTGFRGMTIREWLPIVGALLIPVVIAAGTWGITWQQGKIEDQRAQAEQELAEQRAQDEALQAYLDQMSTLMLEKDLRNSGTDSEVSTLARARTLSVLGRVDTRHKNEIMQFLLEAGLVQQESYFREGESAPVLRGPVLLLHGANLGETDLEFASLYMAVLTEADLSGANLRRADLRGAHLYQADLSGANLIHADLRNTNLIEADLSGAELKFAKLGEAGLGEADLSSANLSSANLSRADLYKANLNNAQGITNEELEQQSSSLKGAIMPNGQTYEDWLKDREGRKEDGKNGGSS
jgi:uncharacterized protein YjbI with pentapeptide repeats